MCPRNPARNARMRDAAREKILAASLEVFVERGFEGASVGEIARRSGVSKGLPYHYFDTKEELLAAALEGQLGALEAVVAEASTAASPGSRLTAFAAGLLDYVRDRPGVFRLYLGLLLGSSEPELEAAAAPVRARMESYLAWMDAVFAELDVAAPELEALYFRSALLGLCFRVAAGEDDLPMDGLLRRLLDGYSREEQ